MISYRFGQKKEAFSCGKTLFASFSARVVLRSALAVSALAALLLMPLFLLDKTVDILTYLQTFGAGEIHFLPWEVRPVKHVFKHHF